MGRSWRLDLAALLGFRRARRVVARESVGRLVSHLEATAVGRRRAAVEDVVDAYRRAVHGRFGSTVTCLPRAFGLATLLRRHGHDAALVIGVRPEDIGTRGLENGHAWVEIDGRPVDEPDGKVDAYQEFLRAPKTAGRAADSSPKD